jgi:hypothetical protein
VTLTIPSLDLNPAALAGAHELYRQCPWVKFPSGRRSLAKQAHVMACNVAVRRDFISRVYIHGGEELQLVVNRHPEWETVEQLAHGLYAYLHDEMTPEKVVKLSRHMTGDAFDVLPILDNAEQANQTIHVIQKLTGLDRFLTREAGLPRWHVQFVAEINQTTET